MIQPRGTKLPSFKSGQQLKASSLQTMSNALGHLMTSEGHGVQQPLDLVVILDEDLDAADNSKTGATKAQATVLQWDPDNEEFFETDRQEDVWNHSEHTDHVEDTFGIARWLDGHWWFFGDCDAMSARDET